MGLSSKQVSNDLHPWNNHHHPLPQSISCTEAAIGNSSTVLKDPPKLTVKRKQPNHGEGDKCPRCGSGNTKFCYYNNYNKTQPRHFCKECKRHWTKGGTLRNVPVGGGRKHKRIKTSSSSSSNAAAKSIGLVGITDKKSNFTQSSSSILKPQQNNLSPQFGHIFGSSTVNDVDNTNGLFVGKISASPSDHHLVQINHLLGFSGSSTSLPYQSLMGNSTTTTTANNPSSLDESLSIFNSSNYTLNSSFQTSTYGYSSDQSTSLELDGSLSFGGDTKYSMNYDHSWKSAITTTGNNLQLGWDEIDKFVSSDEIDVSWDIDSEINYG